MNRNATLSDRSFSRQTDKNLSADNTRDSKSRIDKKIWGLYLGIVVVSLVELYSASSREVTAGHILAPLMRHAMLLGVGCLIMLGLQKVHYLKFYKYTWWIVAISVAAAIYTMFFGQIINGARRSFNLIFFSVQYSELLKFSAALLIARVLGDGQVKINGRPVVTNKAIIIVAASVLIFSIMLVNQGLTNTILLMAISLSLMIIGGVSFRQLMIVGLVYTVLGGGYAVYKVFNSSKVSDPEQTEQVSQDKSDTDRTDLRIKRIKDHFARDKYNHKITSDNQQAQYSFIAQANGGAFGVFPGNSRETARLPLAFSDYIYAIIIEDCGFAGGFAVMWLYLLLLFRAGRIAMNCKKTFPALLVLGMAVFIVYQALFHMAIVTGLFPVSGQPLPFISKGGSSVIISSVALGIMLSVSRFATRQGENTSHEDAQFVDTPQ